MAGIGIGVAVGKGSRPLSGPFTLGSLSPLAWHDASFAAGLFQNVAGTIPAGDGDPVGLMVCRGSTGNGVTQASDLVRPLRSGSTLALDGTRRIFRLTLAGGVVAQPYTLILVGAIENDMGVLMANGSSSAVTFQRAVGSTALRGTAGALLNAAAPDLATRRALVFEVNGASSKLYANGAQVGATGNAGANALNGVTYGSNNGSGSFAIGHFCEGAVVPGALTGGQFARLWPHLSAKWSLGF